jgi:hypothetical protein
MSGRRSSKNHGLGLKRRACEGASVDRAVATLKLFESGELSRAKADRTGNFWPFTPELDSVARAEAMEELDDKLRGMYALANGRAA